MRFIHLSDLHFYPAGDGRYSRKMREKLIAYLKDKQLSANELLITGDFRHAEFQKKEKNDIDEVVKYIWEIADAVHIRSAEHIHLVPGNHDRDRIKTDGNKMSQIRKKYDSEKGTFEKDALDYLKNSLSISIWFATLYMDRTTIGTRLNFTHTVP